MTLSPFEYPVDRVITDKDGFLGLTPNLPVGEIRALHESGLSTDEDGETVFENVDDEIPFGWRVIEADDPSFFYPEEIL